MSYYLGLDIGTGGSRALLVDEAGSVRHAFTAPHEEMIMERPLWAEQRPENWWDAAQSAIRGVLTETRISGDKIKGVGLSGQMHGLVILDRMQPDQKNIFYGCFTGWHLVSGAKAALDLDMESGSKLRLYNDGTRYRTRIVRSK